MRKEKIIIRIGTRRTNQNSSRKRIPHSLGREMEEREGRKQVMIYNEEGDAEGNTKSEVEVGEGELEMNS